MWPEQQQDMPICQALNIFPGPKCDRMGLASDFPHTFIRHIGFIQTSYFSAAFLATIALIAIKWRSGIEVSNNLLTHYPTTFP